MNSFDIDLIKKALETLIYNDMTIASNTVANSQTPLARMKAKTYNNRAMQAEKLLKRISKGFAI